MTLCNTLTRNTHPAADPRQPRRPLRPEAGHDLVQGRVGDVVEPAQHIGVNIEQLQYEA